MKLTRKTLARVPGWSASVLMVVVTVFWTYWGIAEMYHEGWWGAWTNRLPYLVPIAVTLIPGLVAFRWPLVGGALIVVIGLFAAVFFGGGVTVIGLAIALTGGAFVFDGLIRRRAPSQPAPAPMPWWRRHWRYVLLLGAPLIVAVGISAATLPIVLGRVDDGDRSARLIEGNGVTLIWAPEGPGWNWLQPWGGYPSWQRIALYGVPPLGLDDKPGYGRRVDGAGEGVYATAADMAERNLCRYLSADGTTLLDQPQDLWRMPTTDEVVRTLGRHGMNAGCVWRGNLGQAECAVRPDKESPLWAADQAPVYYWTADAYSDDQGYFVAYNGMVNATYKLGGNPRHGYRCVREP